jgi:putative ABC transport system permease protein
VGRLGWSHVRSGLARSLALLLGMFLAATAFTVLTAASRTAQLRTVGTVSAHFQPAYDILVRPKGARTKLEDQTGTVQPDFLGGIYGGITMAQYHQIARVSGVQVAAPIAMVGYSLLRTDVNFTLPAADYARPGRQLYRISTTWVSDGGTSRIAQPATYIYITPDKVATSSQSGDTTEVLPGGRRVTACPYLRPAAGQPFGAAAQGGSICWSKADGYGPGNGPSPARPDYSASWTVPVLIAAVDPVAEARLDGLNRALVAGRYLTENARDRQDGTVIDEFPVLAASSPGMDEYAVTQLQQLARPAAPPVISTRWLAAEARVPGQAIASKRSTVQQAYQQVLQTLSPKSADRIGSNAYWSVGPVSYQRQADGALSPVAVRNSPGVWFFGALSVTGMDNADSQYRTLTAHGPEDGDFTGDIAAPLLTGVFDPARVRAFDPLSQVPLGAYQPLAVQPASAASRRALHGQDLLPTQNLGGLVTQPVDLITSLSALPALHNIGYYGSNLPIADPISVIRVRVAGVTGPNAVSLERIKEVAQQIAVSTHLDVDIVAGSSPEPVTIDLPAGRFGQPALSLSEGWIKKGVAVSILRAVDRSSLVLFVLILIVCALFVANSATAAVRGRRRELGVLTCLGWTRTRLFGAVLGELAAIGLLAGLLAAAASLPAAALLGLHASAGRALLAVPAAVAVAVVAGAPPAWLAARADPVAAVRPPVLGVRRGHQPGGVTAMAMRNVARTPGRALIGTVSLAVGITALTLLTAVSFAFRGVVVGSLLGDAVAVQVRSVDYIAVAVTVVLGILAVADVVFLNIAERAAELATLRAMGWGEPALSRLVITEGTVIGLTGSLAGAALGLAGAAEFTGQLPVSLCLLAAAACIAGTAITATAAFLPARTLNRLPTARLLAEE